MTILKELNPTLESHIENEISKLNNVLESEVIFSDVDHSVEQSIVRIVFERDLVKYLYVSRCFDEEINCELYSKAIIRLIGICDPCMLER